MTLRIAVGGFLHETHSFAPRPTVYADFENPGAYPPLVGGDAMLTALRGSATALAGAIPVLEAGGAVLVPLLWCLAMPAGPIADTAFERIAAQIGSRLSDALLHGPIDGVYLDLHGAALTVSFPDAEGELLARFRRILGEAVPIAISLDPHANLTAAMVAHTDAIVPYRTYPHVDHHQAGARAAGLLLGRIGHAVPFAKAYRQLDYWFSISSQCTLTEPMASVMAEREAIARRHDVAELGFCFGFPYADFADCGAAISCHAETQAQADAAADALLAVLRARESEFQPDAVPAGEAVAEALRASIGASRPVILADTQDNPGGGGHCDTTGLLAELVAQKASGSVLCLINDAEAAGACHAAGVGSVITLALGGRSDGVPFVGEATVVRLGSGDFAMTGPMGLGNTACLGPCCLVEFEPGVRVMIASRKTQALDQAILRHLGVEPAACRILALKSSVHFRADFGPIAERVIIAASPGPVVADPSSLPFRHVRAGVRMRAGG